MKRIALFVLFFVSTACTKNPQSDAGLPDFDMDLPALNTKAGNFSSCDEILQWRLNKVNQWNYYSGPVDTHPGITYASAGAAAPAQTTNTQERGIDEPDMVKADDKSIFVARAHSVEIVNQDSLALEQSLDFPMMRDIQLYYDSGKLIVMGNQMSMPPTQPCCNQPPVYAYIPPRYSITFLERGSDGKFAATAYNLFYGNLLGARLKDGAITLVTSEYLDWNTSYLDSSAGEVRGVSCTNFQRPLVDDFSPNITYVHQIPVAAPQSVQSLARFGRVDQIYMGETNLYLLTGGYDWFWRDMRYAQSEQQNMLFAAKYTIDSGPAFSAAGMIQGFYLGPWSFNETSAPDFLYAVTYDYGGGYNRLWTLAQSGSDLNLASPPVEFAYGEDLRSVRFLGDKAYVVTFRHVDPLSVFDLSTPGAPQLVSTLDVPGFSAYLHPLANGKLLGIGYSEAFFRGTLEAGGVQVSQFDVSNPAIPAALSSETYGDRYSFTDVAVDHHAIFLDETAQILAFPVRLFKTPVDSYTGTLDFSGAMVLNPSAPSISYQKISHWDWIPETCRSEQSAGSTWWSFGQPSMDVRRLMKVGNALISISPFGLRASDVTNGYSTLRELQFAGGEDECSSLMPLPMGAM
jgi:inhibitor of cysteine peptidase